MGEIVPPAESEVAPPAEGGGKPRTCQSCFRAVAVVLKRTPSGKRRWKCERCLRWSGGITAPAAAGLGRDDE
jgi:hypothetical protein